MPVSPTLVWFRQDLRLQDNPALNAARARGGAIIPVYILDDEGEGKWKPGAASRWWLHHSLTALETSLNERGSKLILAKGDSSTILQQLLEVTGATALYWNRRYEPVPLLRDAKVEKTFSANGIEVGTFNSALLFEPDAIRNKQGNPFQVFTPYWRHCLTQAVEKPTDLPTGNLPAPKKWPASAPLATLELRPKIKWDDGLVAAWQPGETFARLRLKKFVSAAVDGYGESRNRPAGDLTSRFSPALHFGEISPRQVWAALKAKGKRSGVFPAGKGDQIFLSEIGWREFAYHLLFHFPQTPDQPLREKYAAFPWRDDPGHRRLRAWQRGRTGYPIVDAGMRQLWHTGWMHNRVRMIVASFLVKHLLLSWTHGASWFWDTLVDADLASNTLGWQWSAGCGADAAPYFRIFAPVLQGEKFDGDGEYVRRWVPELARLPKKYLHAPWTASKDVLKTAGVDLGTTYPGPIVDHAEARKAALIAFKSLRPTTK